MSSLVWWDIIHTTDWPYMSHVRTVGSPVLAFTPHTEHSLLLMNSLSAAPAAIEAGSGNHTENRQRSSYENFCIQIWKKLNYKLHSIFKKIKINKWQRPAFGTRSWGRKNTPIQYTNNRGPSNHQLRNK